MGGRKKEHRVGDGVFVGKSIADQFEPKRKHGRMKLLLMSQ